MRKVVALAFALCVVQSQVRISVSSISAILLPPALRQTRRGRQARKVSPSHLNEVGAQTRQGTVFRAGAAMLQRNRV